MTTRVTIAAVCTTALALFTSAISILHWSQQSQIRDEFNRRHHRKLRTILTNHEDLRDKFVIFLDIDGVIAPYRLDPTDDDADDDTSHFHYDDDTKAKLQAHHCWRPFTDDTMAAFSSILGAIPTGKSRVVLSSFWRIHSDCRIAILESFRAYGAKHGGPLKDFQFFADRTGEIVGVRQVEIAKWLKRFNPHNNLLAGWLVLDDADLSEGPERLNKIFRGHVVRPNEDDGLTSADAAKAIELIKRQLEEA